MSDATLLPIGAAVPFVFAAGCYVYRRETALARRRREFEVSYQPLAAPLGSQMQVVMADAPRATFAKVRD
jgi:hypothetical protein